MWSRSTGVMLSQNWRTWLKWSSYDAGALRVFAPATVTAASRNAPSLGARVEGAPAVERVRPVRRDAAVHGVLVEPVAQHVVDRRVRPVDRDLVEVRAAQAGELGVDVGEQPRLHQRVVGDVDARHQVADVEGDLLGLGEVVRRVARQRQQADRLHRRVLLGHELRRVEQVDALERLLGVVLEDLDAQLPLGKRAGLDRVGEVAAVEVGVHPREHLRLLPGQGVHAQHGLPVELDQRGAAVGVEEPERVHPEPLHGPVRARDAAVGHVPDRVVLGLGVQGDEVPERVVGALRLGDLPVRVRLAGVDDVGELDPVLDEEHRDVVADQVEGALGRVELRGEPAGVADGVRRAARAQHRREPDEHVRRDAFAEEGGAADARRRCRSPRRRRAHRRPARAPPARGCARGRSG